MLFSTKENSSMMSKSTKLFYPTRQSPRPISQAMVPGLEVIRVTTVALQVEQVTWQGPGPRVLTNIGVTNAIVGAAGAGVTVYENVFNQN